MNTRQTKILAIVLVVLLAGLFASKLSKDGNNAAASGLLFPDLKAEINDISRVMVSKAGESVTLSNDGQWVVVEHQNYPADTGKLRKLLLSLADAKRLEEKTSNAELYGRLGVEDTTAESQGTEIRLAAADSERAIIIGNLAQRKYRYARIPGEKKSWLIDQNPTLPVELSGWLLPEILDIDSTNVKSVTISHSDRETIHIDKEDATVKDYTVADIPEGRELSYPSVVDSIARVLSGLNLESVATASETERDDTAATSVYTTFDGLEITVRSSVRDENTWITVSAKDTDTASDQATKINERVDGWQYQIQSYKATQLRRRWDDILKAEE